MGLSLDTQGDFGVAEKDVYCLSGSLKALKSLKRLNLCFHNCFSLSSKGLKIFSENLKRFGSLEKLKFDFLSCPQISDFGLMKLGECLKRLHSLRDLELCFEACPEISLKGIFNLVRNLKALAKLERIKLNFSFYGFLQKLDIERLAQDLKRIRKLKFLEIKSLGWFYITWDQKIKMQEILKNHPTLSKATFKIDYDEWIIVFGKKYPDKTWKRDLLVGLSSLVPIVYWTYPIMPRSIKSFSLGAKNLMYAFFYCAQYIWNQHQKGFYTIEMSV